ncbi:MAG: hypothetical protein M1496_00970 [Candidatus Thermoplasmatota archaeon]|nr:hypothetical protein [Candidatus Thermoplasmatota archaeon]
MEPPLQRSSNNLVLPDTNILIYSVEQNIDLNWELSRKLGSHRMVIIHCVREELEGLSKSITAASVALKIYSQLEEVSSRGHGDACIEDTCLKTGGILVTNDRELAKKLRDKEIRVLNLRDGRNLEWYR